MLGSEPARTLAAFGAPANAGTHATWNRLLFALALVVASVFPAVAVAESADVQTLTQATFVRSDAATPPSDAGEILTLPDTWDLRRPGVAGYAWYVVDWPLAAVPDELRAIYLTATTLPTQVFVNGVSVGLTGSLTGRRPRTWEQSELFEVPTDLLHTGTNRIALRVNSPRAGIGGMGPIVAGPYAAVRELRLRDLLVHTIGPAIVSVTVVVVGLSIIVLWLRRRDPAYLLFGSAAVLWGLHTAVSLLPEPLLPQPHWTIWWHAVYMLFVVLLCLFCVRFAGVEWRAYRRASVAFAVGVVPVLYAANAAGRRRRGIGVGATHRHCVRRRRADGGGATRTRDAQR